MKPLLGCIADDFTGATDLAGMLVANGMRTVQMIGLPRMPAPAGSDAIVIALKTRTAPAEEAVDASRSALRWLRDAGCRQFVFKYCSTFDSTDRGNIGPVAEALMDDLRVDLTIACPAFPANGRTVFRGYLFVGDGLLHESGMQSHPLTPMTDSNLVRVLQRQSKRRVGLVRYDAVRSGAAGIERALSSAAAGGVGIVIVDAVCNEDLLEIGAACSEMRLVTGGSGLAIGLAANFRGRNLLSSGEEPNRLPHIDGASAVIAGSCSAMTRQQVAAMKEQAPSYRVDPLHLATRDVAAEALEWASPYLGQTPILIYATAGPEEVKAAQSLLGVERTGALVEAALAEIACGLVERGVTRLIVAGGETAGAVVGALGVTGLRIGAEISPGVPWTVSLGDKPLALALKSGNFGGPNFFLEAWSKLP